MIHMSRLDREVYEIDELQTAGSNWRRDSPQSVHHLEMARHIFLYDDLAAAISININDQPGAVRAHVPPLAGLQAISTTPMVA